MFKFKGMLTVWFVALPVILFGWTARVFGQESPVNPHSLLTGSPAVAKDAQGNEHRVWAELIDGNLEIFHEIGDQQGKVLAGPQRITQAQGISAFPRVLVNSAGEIHILWLDNRDYKPESLTFELYYKRLDASGKALTLDQRLTRPAPDGAGDRPKTENPSSSYCVGGFDVILGANDQLQVAWAEFNGIHSEIYYGQFNKDGVTTAVPQVVSGGTFTKICLAPRLIRSENAIAILYAAAQGNSEAQIYYSQLDTGGNVIVKEKPVTLVHNGSDLNIITVVPSQSSDRNQNLPSSTPNSGGAGQGSSSNRSSVSSQGASSSGSANLPSVLSTGQSSNLGQGTQSTENFPGHPIFDQRYLRTIGGTITGTLTLAGNLLPDAAALRDIGSLQKPFSGVFTQQIFFTPEIFDNFTEASPGNRNFNNAQAGGEFHFRTGTPLTTVFAISNAGTITTASVTSASIVTGTITTADIAAAGVTSVNLAAGTARDNLGITQNQVNAISAAGTASAGNRFVTQDELGTAGNINGTGTANFVAKFIGTTTIANSQIFDDGTFVGVGTFSPLRDLHVQDTGGSTIIRVQSTGSLSNAQNEFVDDGRTWLAGVRGDTGHSFVITDDTGGANLKRMVIAPDGDVGFGTTDPFGRSEIAGAGTQLSSITTYSTDSQARSEIAIRKSHSNTVGTAATTQDGELLGRLTFWGVTTSNTFSNDAGGILVRQEGTAGPVRIPGRLEFYTSTNAEPGGVTRMTINSVGNTGFQVLNPGNIVTVKQGSATDPIADAWTTYSSIRWKTNVQTMTGAMDKVSHLRGVSFDWKETGKHDIGLVAEEVGQVVPEVVTYEENGVDARSIDYARLVPVLIEAIQEQQSQIDTLKQEVANLKHQQ